MASSPRNTPPQQPGATATPPGSSSQRRGSGHQRKSSIGGLSEAAGACMTPKVARRLRPEWAEPDVSIHQERVTKNTDKSKNQPVFYHLMIMEGTLNRSLLNYIIRLFLCIWTKAQVILAETQELGNFCFYYYILTYHFSKTQLRPEKLRSKFEKPRYSIRKQSVCSHKMHAQKKPVIYFFILPYITKLKYYSRPFF